MGKFVKKTTDERKAEAKALHDTLANQVESLAGSDEWKAFLAFAASFHNYSLNNVLLILSQRPTASRVAGFRQWQAKGRVVRKGERSIKIFGFSSKKITETNADTGEEETRRLARFPILSVFDIAQTEPIEGWEGVDVSEYQAASRLTGDDPDGIYAAMSEWLESESWTVSREAIGMDVNGYTKTDGSKRVVVEESLAPAQAAKTIIHESAHVCLHTELDPGEYVAHRGVCETEAESVAYVLAGMPGLDTSAYSIGYVAGWANGDAAIVRAAAANVLATVARLAPAILGECEEAVNEAA